MKIDLTKTRLTVGETLVLASIVSIGFFAAGVVRNHTFDYSFMVWNLFLAWVPLAVILWLQRWLKTNRWSSWQGISLTLLWLGFLPNSFYMVTDYIHLADTPRVDVLFDAVMLTSFVVTGLVLGFLSLQLFQSELAKRVPRRTAGVTAGLIILLCSMAIYMGRDLRWNTWDLFVNPAGILFDVSDRMIYPREHVQMFVTVTSFFVLLSLLYLLVVAIVPYSRPADDR